MYSPKTPILVVEPQETHRKLLVSTLKTIGFKNVATAESSEQAWTMLKQQVGMEIIISDWEGTHTNGLDLLLKIRDDEDLKDLGYIIMSGEGAHDQILLAIKAGCDLYIKKPFAAKTIESKLKELFKIRGSRS